MGWEILGGANPITAHASAIPGVGQFLSTNAANQANKDIASARNIMEVEEALKARQFSSNEASKNRFWQSAEAKMIRDFNERMSSTAIQRRMKDLKAGGLNPILAGKFDASSPTGSMGGGAQGAPSKANSQGAIMQPAFIDSLGIINSLMDVQAKRATINKVKADTRAVQTGLPKKGIGESIYEPIYNDIKTLKDWANKFQSNARQGKYFQEPLDQADKALEETVQKLSEKIKNYGVKARIGKTVTPWINSRGQ